MLRIHAIGLAVLALLVVGAIGASSASAEVHGLHLWLLGRGHDVLVATKVHTLGLLLLEDSKATGGAVKIHCKGYDDGWVYPRGLDLILHIANSLHNALLGIGLRIHCTFDKAGLCQSSSLLLAQAVHLPWLTLLVLHGTEVRDLIERDPNAPGGGGSPGWLVTCTSILGGETVDECTNELGSTTVVNKTNGEGVESEFDNINPVATCSIGGAGAGVVSGSVLTESPSATEPLLYH